MNKEYENAIKPICKRLLIPLKNLNEKLQSSVQEIRLRANMPLCLTVGGENLYLSSDGYAENVLDSHSVICDKTDIFNTFSALCEYSVYAYQQQINNGFITAKNGGRIGICGSVVSGENGVKTIKNISSLNIRIAREHKLCASKIINKIKQIGLCNTLIIGSPSSGKTTVLRDIIYQLSSAKTGRAYRVCAVDERYELCAASSGTSVFDLGTMCDILSGIAKYDGIMIALRTQNPQVIVFDEIASEKELFACYQSFCAGANIITSVHANGLNDLINRPLGKKLIESDFFDCFVFLDSVAGMGMKIYTKNEVKNEIFGNNSDFGNTGHYRLSAFEKDGCLQASANDDMRDDSFNSNANII